MVMQRTAFALSAIAALFGFAAVVMVFDTRDWLALMHAIAGHIQSLIAHGYRVAPALMLGFGLLVVIPAISIVAPLVSRVRRSSEATRRFKASPDDHIAVAITGDTVNHPAARPAHAFVEVVGSAETRFAIPHDMLRIGREEDNDIRIPSNAVHRYHAAIYREHRDDWHIADLSGTDGNGIRVNGQRCSDARLNDGDVIDLGPGRLRFRAGFI